MARGMYVNCIEAQELPGDGPVADKPRFRFLRADDRAYIAKSALCPKITSHLKKDFFYLPAWLANELVYWEFVKSSSLRVPPVARLTFAGEPFVGSEYIETRLEVRDSTELTKLVRISQDNTEQAAMAIVFDLALLNSDREPSAVLKDEAGRLWFIDHDKALWGDCRQQGAGDTDGTGLSGDLGRIDPTLIDKKFDDFIADYLACKPINQVVWHPDRWKLVQDIWNGLRLDPEIVVQVPATLPEWWIPNSERQIMRRFLVVWWNRLHQVFADSAGYETIRASLAKRGRI